MSVFSSVSVLFIFLFSADKNRLLYKAIKFLNADFFFYIYKGHT